MKNTSNKKLNIAYLYPDLLNLYGDNGNVEILVYRAQEYGFEVDVHRIGIDDTHLNIVTGANLMFMGGGPDSSQKSLYEDLIKNKRNFVSEFIESGKPGLYICGSYQLLGNYYKSADGTVLEGLGVFDLYTAHFGKDKPRCIGNTMAELLPSISSDVRFPASPLSLGLVGFENHGGRTYLGEKVKPLASVIKGFGNNGEDGYEGVLYKQSIGSYFHGPILSRNPHLADWLIFSALQLTQDELANLPKIDDTLAIQAHTASRNLRQ